VIWPISVHGGTCGTTRARRVSAAAASAVSASPSRVPCGARVLITSRSTRASQTIPWVRSHSTWAGSRTPRIQRRTVDSGRASWGSDPPVPRPARGAGLHTAPITAVVSARRGATTADGRTWVPRQERQRARRGRSSTVVVPCRARCGPGRAPRLAADRRCTPGRSARRRRGRSRPDQGRRHRSSGRGEGTAHERGLPGPRLPGVSRCGSHPAAVRRVDRVARARPGRHDDDLR
jgi:hypothetical protein